jgi:hypothetical protein
MIRNTRAIHRAAAICLALGLGAGCDRSPTALDSTQRDGLRAVIEAAQSAGEGSVEASFRNVAWRLATTVEPTPRLPVLEELFERALERAARTDGEGAAALRREHDEMEASAWAAVAAGRRDDADGGLTAARTFMATQTVAVLGEPVAAAYIAILGLAVDRAAARMDLTGAPLPARTARMLASARNLHRDSGNALLRGDYVRAIDIAGHAAGLINTLQAALR